MKIIFTLFLLTALSGCSNTDVKNDTAWMPMPPTEASVESPSTFPDIDFEDISFAPQKKWRVMTNKAEIEEKTNNYIRHGQGDVIVRPDGTILYPYGLAPARLITKKMLYSKVVLQEGERIMSVACGDTLRWYILPNYIGDAKWYTPIILVKPFMGGLQTNLSIITNKRDYDVLIQSIDTGDYMPRVGFYYPQDKADAIHVGTPPENKETSLQPKINIENIKYDYRIRGDEHLEWYPQKVFEDGRKVFIKMPEATGYGQLPIFMSLDSHHQPEVVNYRYLKPYFIIDTIFKQGILILGTDQYKQIIQLTKTS